jgi:hypothetical protein
LNRSGLSNPYISNHITDNENQTYGKESTFYIHSFIAYGSGVRGNYSLVQSISA